MQTGSKIGIVCCSNGFDPKQKTVIDTLVMILEKSGFVPQLSPYLYADEHGFSGTAKQRAEALMSFYEDDSIEEIFDISGGDMANQILPYLDYTAISYTQKRFWGYSDLTTLINAIYARTGKTSVLYQIRNLTYDHSAAQLQDFLSTALAGTNALYSFPYEFIRGTHMQGIAVGGNIRCLLKLAGTPYWPDMRDKILVLEAYGGKIPQMVTYLSQLSQLGVFQKINGILLGSFTKMEEAGCQPDMKQLILEFVPKDLPIACTSYIGHGTDAKAIRIGHRLKLFSQKENERIAHFLKS